MPVLPAPAMSAAPGAPAWLIPRALDAGLHPAQCRAAVQPRAAGRHARWLSEHGTKDFTAALRSLAAQLDDTPGLVNYQNRRQAMQGWCLDPETWQYLTSRLPPVPGPVQPVLDDRKRQEASAFTWARVTQGEPGSHPGRSRPPSRNQSAGTGPHTAPTRGTSSPAPGGSSTTPNCASSSSGTPAT